MQIARLSLVLASVLLLGSVGRAHADALCIASAKADYLACKAQCKDDFQSAKFACRGVQPDCGKACLAGRDGCFDDVNAILDTGVLPSGGGNLDNCVGGTDKCKADLKTAKTGCGAPCNGNTVCDGCVDAAQVVAFVCRDTCRESWRANTTVKALASTC